LRIIEGGAMVNKDNSASDRSKWALTSVGSVLPETLCMQMPACNMSGNKFQIELLKAIRTATGEPIYTISTLPIGVFPKSKRIVSAAADIDIADGVSGLLIPFINVFFLKQISIGVMNFVVLSIWLWKHRRERRFVLVYNLYPPMSYPVLAATRLLGGKAVAVVPDFPHKLSFNFQGWKGVLTRINVWLEAYSLSYFAGIIPFTQYVVEDFAPGRPMMIMEGGVDPTDAYIEPEPTGSPLRERICFFSGTLYDVNGIDLLLKAFHLISDPNYRLWIFGKGPLESQVRAASQQDNRIVYWGFMSNAEVMCYQRRATVLLNARPTDQLVARYTFPSKLREYMLSGRPVITTLLPGIPKEYFDFVYPLLDETPEGLACLLTNICEKPAFELNECGHQARKFVLQNKNWTIQGRRVYEFIRGL